jgi:hypothetical protein
MHSIPTYVHMYESGDELIQPCHGRFNFAGLAELSSENGRQLAS